LRNDALDGIPISTTHVSQIPRNNSHVDIDLGDELILQPVLERVVKAHLEVSIAEKAVAEKYAEIVANTERKGNVN
jgi:hypothetical protein